LIEENYKGVFLMFKSVVIAAVAMLVLLTGCGEKDGAKSGGSKKKIAVIPKAYDVDFWKVVCGGFSKAKVENPDYEIVWQPPAINGDSASQKATVETLIGSRYDVISLCPIDEKELLKTIASAKKSGSKVLVWDSGVSDESNIETFIATDNYQGGVLGAKALAEALPDGGTVIMLRYVEGSASTTKREQGFMDTIKNYPKVKYKELNQRGGGDEATAKKASETILQSNKDIAGVFCPNQTTTEGMLLALKQFKLNGKVKVVGFDFNDQISAAIKSGDLHATAAQNPFRMGYLAVTEAIKVLKGEKVDKRIDTGVTIVTKDNIDSAEMKEILFPDYKGWIEKAK
jgi:ribose transport system substrate-binding protein